MGHKYLFVILNLFQNLVKNLIDYKPDAELNSA